MIKNQHLRYAAAATVAMLLLLAFGAQGRLHAMETLRVGIVPFSIYSSENVEYLQEVISTRLSEQLDTHAHITVVGTPSGAVAPSGQRALGTDALAQQAKALGADYLIYGSMTMIEDEVSIDARAFTTLPEEQTFRSFVVGTDFDRLITRIETRLADHLRTVATTISVPEEPVIEEEPLAEPATVFDAVAQMPALAGPAAQQAPEQPSADVPASVTVESAQTAVPVPPAPQPTEEAPPLPEPPAVTQTPEPAEKEEKSQPVMQTLSRLPGKITANRMVADNSNRTVTFFGDVKASSAELLIFSDEMAVVYTKGQEIETITAQGNVKINQKDITASCQMANFLQGDQKIILTGKPKVWQGNNMVTGQTITILLDQDTIIVDGEGEDRVNVILYPEKK